ncbi:hypothetical protein KIKIMORA_00850 [Brevundimonas phage vB_BpoS-Kikimora]|uniref:Uncharacterized protein n=1 Tax=Brevundimonas phage vB_BpoS-Kikimora TaxID=2948601 RepID=A0A9E7MT72_9CAUD|nr:hypothetical protein KIKIMORA_00850 [Brevundimonas phage vB_BpoS-Kikimora]
MDDLLSKLKAVGEALAESDDPQDQAQSASFLWWWGELDTAWEKTQEYLRDPQAVLINIMRGGIAKLSPNAIASLYRGAEGQAVIDAIWRESANHEDLVDDLAIRLCAASGTDPLQETWHTTGPGEMEPYGPAWVHYRPQAIDLMRGIVSPATAVSNPDELN